MLVKSVFSLFELIHSNQILTRTRYCPHTVVAALREELVSLKVDRWDTGAEKKENGQTIKKIDSKKLQVKMFSHS